MVLAEIIDQQLDAEAAHVLPIRGPHGSQIDVSQSITGGSSMSHKYPVGQLVQATGAHLADRTRGIYEVIHLMTESNSEFGHCIKNTANANERAAKESRVRAVDAGQTVPALASDQRSPLRWRCPTVQRIRSTLFDGVLAVWTALFVPVLVVLWLWGSPERGVRRASRLWVHGVLLGLRWLVGLTYVERGQHNIPDEPCLIIANHQSTWETLAFLILFPDVAIVAKQELLTVPVFSWFLRQSPMILIDRESGARAVRKMVEESLAALAQGRSVLIFPEGTRKPVSEPIALKRGVELLYAKSGRPALPVAVNSGHFWGPGQPYKKAGTIAVSYLDPIPPGLAGRDFMGAAERVLEAERRSSWPRAA